MADRPILFSGPMVRALLDGSKTQTRRVVKWRGPDVGLNMQFSGLRAIRDRAGMWALESDTRTSVEVRTDVTPCPYGLAGDRLWVRETWAPNDGSAGGYLYRADQSGASGFHQADLKTGVWTHSVSRWRPSIHMPRAASRINLEITGVRVERLQAISEADALAEGVARCEGDTDYFEVDGGCVGLNARESYSRLWNAINGAGSVEANPWVWVVEFKRATQEPNP
jgi:hypothetical protein